MTISHATVEEIKPNSSGRVWVKLRGRAGDYVELFGPDHVAAVIASLDKRIAGVEVDLNPPVVAATVLATPDVCTPALVNDLTRALHEGWQAALSAYDDQVAAIMQKASLSVSIQLSPAALTSFEEELRRNAKPEPQEPEDA